MENITPFLDEVISPLVANLTTYFNDSTHALNNLSPDQCFLFTMDVNSLYTMIPNDSCLLALAFFLNKHLVFEPPTSRLTCLAELSLMLNAFFNNN